MLELTLAAMTHAHPRAASTFDRAKEASAWELEPILFVEGCTMPLFARQPRLFRISQEHDSMCTFRIASVLALVLIAGCASKPPVQTASNPYGDAQCQLEMRTGSMMTRTICKTQADRDADRAAIETLKGSLATASGCLPLAPCTQ